MKTNFHDKNFALKRLAFRRRFKATRKWPIDRAANKKEVANPDAFSPDGVSLFFRSTEMADLTLVAHTAVPKAVSHKMFLEVGRLIGSFFKKKKKEREREGERERRRQQKKFLKINK